MTADTPASPTRRVIRSGLSALAVVALFVLAGCGDDSAEGSNDSDSTPDAAAEAATGLRLVSPTAAAAIADNPPPGLVVLDVRTPNEFAEGHLAGATMIDFYESDFRDRIAALDPDTPYLLYCRSGNRSGQTLAIMEDLGFTNVADVDGGINAWLAAGLPVATG